MELYARESLLCQISAKVKAATISSSEPKSASSWSGMRPEARFTGVTREYCWSTSLPNLLPLMSDFCSFSLVSD